MPPFLCGIMGLSLYLHFIIIIIKCRPLHHIAFYDNLIS